MISGQRPCGSPHGNALGGFPVRRSLSALQGKDSSDQQPDRAGSPKFEAPPFASPKTNPTIRDTASLPCQERLDSRPLLQTIVRNECQYACWHRGGRDDASHREDTRSSC